MSEPAQTGQEQTRSHERRRGNKFYWRHLSVLSTSLLTLVTLVWVGIPAHSLKLFFAGWVVYAAAYSWLYVDAVRKGRKSYQNRLSWTNELRPPPAPLNKRGRPRFSYPPASHWERIFSFLAEIQIPNPYTHEVTTEYENKLKRWTRRHWIDLVRRIWWTFPAAVVGVLLQDVILEYGKTSGSYRFSSKDRFHVPWWLPPLYVMLATFLVAGAAWVRSWKWSYRYTVLTNWRIMIITAPPAALLPFLATKRETVDLSQIITTDYNKEGIGINFNEGGVGLDTQADRDADFKNIEYLPDPEGWRNDLDAERLAEQRRIEGLAPEMLWLILTQLRGDSTSPDQPTEPLPVIRGMNIPPA